MTEEEFIDIMEDEEKGGRLLKDLKDDNAVMGLMIIRKYLPNKGIEGAEHDVVFSVSVEEIVEAGITKKDTEMLRDLNWMIDSGSLAVFV